MMDWGEEKPNGECWILDFGFWIFDGIQHSAFKI
jgi:hypothetical protein